MKYIKAFSKISGLKCNISKTKVIPIGTFDKDKICPDIDLNWEDDFTLLGFYIDNKLAKLETNIDRIDLKVNNLINKWCHYQLLLHRRVIIAKLVLISQYTYIVTILDIEDEERLNKIQHIIDNFIAYNKFESINKRKLWISNKMLCGSYNGFNMIKIKDFCLGLQVSWVHIYINGIN